MLGIGVIAALVIGWQIAAFAGTVGGASGFQDDDGNLTPNSPGVQGTLDWNSFAPPNWTGTPPPTPFPPNYRTSDVTDNGGWDFFGMLDEFKASGTTTGDSVYKGGTKQSDNCPTLITKAGTPDKDDMKRVYLATKTADVNGHPHVFLNLSFLRVGPLNSTSSSTHLSFEFNQSNTKCTGTGHTDPVGRSLVTRSTASGGDLLIQYDYDTSSNKLPTISISRWTGSAWTAPVKLSAGVAEAAVNEGLLTGANKDALAPPGPNTPADVGQFEFGEAGIDLTAANVFQEGSCVNFGHVSASSRSSGNSNTSGMMDIVGPDEFSLENCGGVIIRKETLPDENPNSTQFHYTTTGGLTPSTFDLTDDESQEFGTEVQEGQYSVTETDPSGDDYALDSIDCSASDTANGTTIDTTTSGTVSFNLKAQDQVDCTFTNEKQTGAIKIHKDRKHAADGPDNHPQEGVDFTIEDPNGDPVTGSPATTDANGDACVDGLTLNAPNETYTVHEETPAGYAANPDQNISVDNTATCEDDPYGGETANFHNTPLTNITVSVDSQVAGGTASTMQCTDSANNVTNGSTGAGGDGSVTVNDLQPTAPTATLTCVIKVDP